MKVRNLLLSASAVLAAFTLSACGKNSSSASKENQTLHLMQTGEIMSLDTANQANISQWNVLENSMEGLYRANKAGNPAPAESYAGRAYPRVLAYPHDPKWCNSFCSALLACSLYLQAWQCRANTPQR